MQVSTWDTSVRRIVSYNRTINSSVSTIFSLHDTFHDEMFTSTNKCEKCFSTQMRTFSLFTDSIFTLRRLFFNVFDFGNCSNYGVFPIEIDPRVSHQKEIEVDSQAIKNKETK